MTEQLPATARELFKLPLFKRIVYGVTVRFFETTGLWTHGMRAYGDLERMRFIDRAYWIYKTTSPIRHGRKDAGLERFFEEQRTFRWALPDDFVPTTEVTVSSVGDLMSHGYITASKDTLYRDVADDVLGADLTMANLECPVVTHARKELVLAFDSPAALYYDLENFEVVRGFGRKQFDFMATACNHALDFGTRGLATTIDTLQKNGIAFNGINATEADATRATIVERNGVRFGIVAYTFGLNAYEPPAERPRIVNRMLLNDGSAANDFVQLRAQLEHCRAENVDFVIAHLHWGLEHELYPTPEQLDLGHAIAELGVDAIIGHHPHVMQPVEYYRTKRDPDRVVPIFYSLGNLINPFTAPYLCSSGVARLTLAAGSIANGSRRVYVREAHVDEIVQEVDVENKKLRLRRA